MGGSPEGVGEPHGAMGGSPEGVGGPHGAMGGSPEGVGGPHGAMRGSPEGVGVDPVFQLYSYLWDLNVWGDEQQYYNLTQVLHMPCQIVCCMPDLDAELQYAAVILIGSARFCFSDFAIDQAWGTRR